MAKRDEDKPSTPDPELEPRPAAVPRIDPLPGGLHDLELPSTASEVEAEADSET
jgi:hypothetical protein